MSPMQRIAYGAFDPPVARSSAKFSVKMQGGAKDLCYAPEKYELTAQVSVFALKNISGSAFGSAGRVHCRICKVDSSTLTNKFNCVNMSSNNNNQSWS